MHTSIRAGFGNLHKSPGPLALRGAHLGLAARREGAPTRLREAVIAGHARRLRSRARWPRIARVAPCTIRLEVTETGGAGVFKDDKTCELPVTQPRTLELVPIAFSAAAAEFIE